MGIEEYWKMGLERDKVGFGVWWVLTNGINF